MVKQITRLGKKIHLKMIRNMMFFIGLIVLTYWLIFKDQDMGELFKLIKSANFVYKAFGLSGYNYIQIFMMQAVLYTTVSSLPLPGAIGVSETIFLKIFEPAFGKRLVSGAMLLSRGITFYLFVIVSLIVVCTAIKTKDIKGEIDKKVIKYDKLEKEK